ncbi:hypothetical protein AAA799E16_00380 [Marine Group I thaumarchaeote SCGC AAA799-E16]|uniref:Uncharacterized protein n=2 Tax=Marine Group I TaxID=905826 RepID=A0A087RVW8_9ARCH|nr:hypothetical protein AAA799E16_00380 [Marine Group I thaumarchaeote SCGC AAA799-E16]KFM17622.1 hypothetical protein SCCGRSA3_01552 [Marine Group I thaumarchaeote SCGC RSA3]
MVKAKIFIDMETLERLKRLGESGESLDAIINRIINYIEFHPEYWDREI